MAEHSGNVTPPGRYDPPASQLIVLNHLIDHGIRIPPAARRRWRRQAFHRERRSQDEWIASNRSSSPRPPSPAPLPAASPDPAPRRMTAVEQVWQLERTPGVEPANINGAPPDPADLAQTADHAALLLAAFSRVKPPDDTQLTPLHKQLVSEALTAVLNLTRRIRVLADEELEPLPRLEDPAYAGCVVCYSALADTLLVPCCHLMLCEVCVDAVRGGGGEC